MPEDAEPSPTPPLRIEAKHDASASTIILIGELDIHTIERFLAAIHDALETHPPSIATLVVFVDSSGLADSFMPALRPVRQACPSASAACPPRFDKILKSPGSIGCSKKKTTTNSPAPRSRIDAGPTSIRRPRGGTPMAIYR